MSALAPVKPVPVKLDNEIRERIAKLAKSRKNSAHALMREAIYEYVEREEKRESFDQETLRAWQEYEENGLHITSAELIDWLSSWGSENEKEMPACHK